MPNENRILMKLFAKVSTPKCSICGKKTKEPYMHWHDIKERSLIKIKRKKVVLCTQNCGIAWLERKN